MSIHATACYFTLPAHAARRARIGIEQSHPFDGAGEDMVAKKSKKKRSLRSKLLLLEHEKREQELAREKGEQKEIAWGSQIRSYVLAPYTLVKDHRTNFEKGNVEAVLNGAIDDFIREYVWQRSTGKLGVRAS